MHDLLATVGGLIWSYAAYCHLSHLAKFLFLFVFFLSCRDYLNLVEQYNLSISLLEMNFSPAFELFCNGINSITVLFLFSHNSRKACSSKKKNQIVPFYFLIPFTCVNISHG